MTDKIKLPRKLSDELKALKFDRPSQETIENIERWANSPGLQPPQRPAAKQPEH